MEDVWFGPNVTHRDLDTVRNALALEGNQSSALIAVFGREPKLALASTSLFKLFGVDDGEELSLRLLSQRDAGGRRLAFLCQNLTIDGAPRLERLRFSIAPASEVLTFLCRRILLDEQPLFVAAALGVGAGPLEAAPDAQQFTPLPPIRAGVQGVIAAPRPRPAPAEAPTVQAIQARLRARWPARRPARFVWRSDRGLVCTAITPPLAEIVGQANADLVGRDLLALAPRLDPSGRLADVLASRTTWSGLDVAWPVGDAAAAVGVTLGAAAAFDRDGAFDGYHGYGLVHLGRVQPGNPEPLVRPVAAKSSDSVVIFPGGGAATLSDGDREAFRALGDELRGQVDDGAGRDRVGNPPLASREPAEAEPPTFAEEAAVPPGEFPHDRAADAARNGLAVLDRIAVALLVSRSNVPIFANRHFLDLTGFADEDALYAAGGTEYLFGNLAANPSGAESVGIRLQSGEIRPVVARMQRLDWDGLPATLLTLQTAASDAPPASNPADIPTALADGEVRDLRAILETATDGVAIVDEAGAVVSFNRGGEALFGRERGEVVGRPFLDLFASPARDLAAEYFEGLKSNATKSLLNDGREILVEAKGGEIPVFMTLGRLCGAGDDDGPPRFCALFRDLTPWKRVERDLQNARAEADRASARKSAFLANVSHELRTPLNSILGFVEIMLDQRFGPLGSDRYKEYLGDIRVSGTHIMSLVDDLLDLSKIEAGKMELASEPVDANRLINEAVALMQPEASRERVIMRLSLAAKLPMVRADERSLRQCMLNVLSNAIRHNEPGGQVIVGSTVTDSGSVVIRVRDTGPGMSHEDLALALEPFHQLASRRASGGTGLGLPLTKALVEANEAQFAIRSGLGQGTMVEVCFPPARVLAGHGNA